MEPVVADARRSRDWIVWLLVAAVPLAVAGFLAHRHLGRTAVPRLDSPVVDAAGLLSDAAERRLEQRSLELQRRKGAQLAVLTVASTRPESIDAYALRVANRWGLGRKGIDDGVLVVVAKDDRRVRIEVGSGLEQAISNADAGAIIQRDIVPGFRAGDFGAGLDRGTAQLALLIERAALPPPAMQP